MDLEAARKALSKRSTISSKRVAFFVVAGVCIIAGIVLHSGAYFTQPQVEQNAPAAIAPSPPPATATPPVEATESMLPQVQQNAPAEVAPEAPPAAAMSTAPTEGAEPTGEVVDEPMPELDEQAESDIPTSGIILVARRPVEVLASPSSSAPALYGFPAGRPFRVIGREGGFAHIQDLKSSASGWIDEAALARPPRDPEASAPAQPRSFSVGRKPTTSSPGPKPKTTQKDRPVTAGPEAAAQPERNRPGLFGRGGLFGGILGNGN
jgi:hypothetical protein